MFAAGGGGKAGGAGGGLEELERQIGGAAAGDGFFGGRPNQGGLVGRRGWMAGGLAWAARRQVGLFGSGRGRFFFWRGRGGGLFSPY